MYCLDTYALIEITNANVKTEKYLNDNIIIPDVVLAEFHWTILKAQNPQTASFWKRLLLPYVKNVPSEIYIKAMDFRFTHKKQKLSFFDCVGYVFAQEQKIPFVTGDKEFKNMKGVDFIES
jgi:predicted nucleic acid-binding protein